jgi:hypothetical protein
MTCTNLPVGSTQCLALQQIRIFGSILCRVTDMFLFFGRNFDVNKLLDGEVNFSFDSVFSKVGLGAINLF